MNLRPAVFYDSLLIKKVVPDDLVYVTSDTGIVRDPKTHHLMAEPDYELGFCAASEPVSSSRRSGSFISVAPICCRFSRTSMTLTGFW